jgi:murein DD-endopeptidase MepM/ murein hydrolase activator NlpD
MQPRRLRPVAALTLALVAAPFLAATAVAAQSGGNQAAPSIIRVSTHRAVWLTATNASVQRIVDTVAFAAAETAAPAAPHTAASAPATAPPGSVADRASWIWPGNGPITSPFGRRWGRMHQGVDIDAGYGSAVIAAQRGTVTAAGWGQTGYGLVVQIDHGNGISTLYAHLSAVHVSVGQVLRQGADIGAVGATGSVTAAHLHYEVHVAGVPVNPMPWLTSTNHSTRGNP